MLIPPVQRIEGIPEELHRNNPEYPDFNTKKKSEQPVKPFFEFLNEAIKNAEKNKSS